MLFNKGAKSNGVQANKEEQIRDHLEKVREESEKILLPMIKEKLKSAETICVSAGHHGEFRFFSTLQNEEVIENKGTVDNRSMLYYISDNAEQYGIHSLPVKPDWNGWIFTFLK